MSLKGKYDIFYDNENNVYQVRTKSDAITISFIDDEKELIFKNIIDLYEKKDFYTFQQIQRKLISKFPYSKILDVIQELYAVSILNSDNLEESSEILKNETDFLPWLNEEYKSLSEIKIGFIGEKELGVKIKEKALLSKYKEVSIRNLDGKVDESEIKKIISENDFLIVDSSVWDPYLMEQVNDIALSLNCPWLLIDGLIDPVNYSIGPIFHGQDSGCYECYRNRVRSNDEFFSYTKVYENYLRENRKMAKPDVVSEPIKDIIANIVVMDISKYLGGWYPPETWRASLIFNSQNYQFSKHNFLKAPICYKCNPILDYNTSPWLESITLKS